MVQGLEVGAALWHPLLHIVFCMSVLCFTLIRFGCRQIYFKSDPILDLVCRADCPQQVSKWKRIPFKLGLNGLKIMFCPHSLTQHYTGVLCETIQEDLSFLDLMLSPVCISSKSAACVVRPLVNLRVGRSATAPDVLNQQPKAAVSKFPHLGQREWRFQFCPMLANKRVADAAIMCWCPVP